MTEDYLNVIDKNDNIIGEETREKIHEQGLLHREIHVYFVTPKKEFILQHRAKDKDTFPDMFDATVGGHVEQGETYLQAAIKETMEETGISLEEDDLIFVKKITNSSHDKKTGKINNATKSEYIHIYEGDIAKLKIEEGKALGFKKFNIEEIESMGANSSNRIIPYIYNFISVELINYLDNKLNL